MTTDRVGMLLTFGFTEYQARVYLALLDFPELAAGALAKAAQVPRNRLYEVLEELQGFGLVEVILGKTRTYRANPLSVYLDRRVAELQERVREIESRKEYLSVAFQPKAATAASLDTGATRVVIGRRSVAREIDRMLEEAERSVVVVSSLGGFDRVIQHLTGGFETRAKGLDVDVYLPKALAPAGGVDRLGEFLASRVRWVDVPFATLSLVVDLEESLAVHPVPDDGRLRVGKDVATLTTDEAHAADLVALLRAASRATTV